MERLTQTSDKGGVAFTFDLDVTCKPSEAQKILRLAEKLKLYEDLGTVEECRNSILDISKAYNKAIDDYAEKLKENISESLIWGIIADCMKYKNMNDTSDKIVDYIIETSDEIAEQLKEQANGN